MARKFTHVLTSNVGDVTGKGTEGTTVALAALPAGAAIVAPQFFIGQTIDVGPLVGVSEMPPATVPIGPAPLECGASIPDISVTTGWAIAPAPLAAAAEIVSPTVFLGATITAGPIVVVGVIVAPVVVTSMLTAARRFESRPRRRRFIPAKARRRFTALEAITNA